ncbi:hypothetical protein [Streptomyces sp. NPDC058739]|uniref:hypothetical protein n=1 Tax=Streptomyces sp. NPDC058739 TaxID=3346618 RepID=UPI0036902B22
MTSRLRSVGFFTELAPGWGLPLDGSIQDAVRPAGEPDEHLIVAYLRRGTGLWSEMSAGPDVLDPEAPHLTAIGSLYTDGTWLWREDLPYYLATYHLALPAAFVDHVREHGHAAPRVPEARLVEIATQDLGLDLGRPATP